MDPRDVGEEDLRRKCHRHRPCSFSMGAGAGPTNSRFFPTLGMACLNPRRASFRFPCRLFHRSDC